MVDKFQEAIRKIKEKAYPPEEVFNEDESAYSGEKKMSKSTFISKEIKRAPGIKTGSNRLNLLFCANVIGFMIRTSLIYITTNP